jgi:peptidoglycan/LPS O-acetylase OafA/YrhL
MLLCATERPYWILNVQPVTWLGKISGGLYLWQQSLAYGDHPRAVYFVLFAVAMASLSYYLLEQPGLRLRERRSIRKAKATL